jgi:hypothetical protein
MCVTINNHFAAQQSRRLPPAVKEICTEHRAQALKRRPCATSIPFIGRFTAITLRNCNPFPFMALSSHGHR